MPELPLIKCFLVADQVIQEKGTNKWSVIGVFDHFWVGRFPTTHPSLGVYVKLADAKGSYTIRLEFRDSSDRVLSMVEGVSLTVEKQSISVDFGLQIRQLPIPSAGQYYFMLFLNEALAGQMPADARLIGEKDL